MNRADKQKTIRTMFDLRQADGDFGIEVELECQTPYPQRVKGWSAHNDGSLKTDYAVEYVTRGPVPHENVNEALTTLRSALDSRETNILYSVRAGVHVHMNMQEYTVEQTLRTALLYYIFETVLTKFCGPNRVGNHFCLRLRDAEYLSYVLGEIIEDSSYTHLYSDHIRYSALNLVSLPKFGSLEFRGMETCEDFSKISLWCDLLHRIRTYAASCETTEELSSKLSYHGPEDFLREVVGQEIFDALSYEGMGEDILEDFRLVQPLIYSLEY